MNQDLSPTMTQMKKLGAIKPATSNSDYQVWIRIRENKKEHGVATLASPFRGTNTARTALLKGLRAQGGFSDKENFMLCQAAICSRWHQDNQHTSINYLSGCEKMCGHPARAEPSQLSVPLPTSLVLASSNN